MKRPPKLSRRERRAARVPSSSPTTYTEVPADLEPFARCMVAVENALDRTPLPHLPALLLARECADGSVSIQSAPVGAAALIGQRIGVDLVAADEIRRSVGADAVACVISAGGDMRVFAVDVRRGVNAPGGAA